MKLKVIILGFRIVLALAFLALCIFRLSKLMKKEVGSRYFINHNAKFPSMAICPFTYNPMVGPQITKGKNLTFADAMNLPSIKDTIDVNVMYVTPYSDE